MRALGIILAGGNSNKLGDLSAKRAVAAMPITGGYRAIDFALSNMTNSHIQKVAVFTQYNTRSLNEHLNSSNGGISVESREDYTSSLQPSQRLTATGIRAQQMLYIRTLTSLKRAMSHMLLLRQVTVYTRWITISFLRSTSVRGQI